MGIEGEEVILLQHMVLSHHGKAEWEVQNHLTSGKAEVLHYIDNLDAKINMMDRALEKNKAWRVYGTDFCTRQSGFL